MQAIKPQPKKGMCTPDMAKRNTMNLILVAAVGLPGSSLLGGYAYFFVPPSSGNSSSGETAKDRDGDVVKQSAWLKTHPPGSRKLTQGIRGDATYLIVKNDGQIADFGLNAICILFKPFFRRPNPTGTPTSRVRLKTRSLSLCLQPSSSRAWRCTDSKGVCRNFSYPSRSRRSFCNACIRACASSLLRPANKLRLLQLVKQRDAVYRLRIYI